MQSWEMLRKLAVEVSSDVLQSGILRQEKMCGKSVPFSPDADDYRWEVCCSRCARVMIAVRFPPSLGVISFYVFSKLRPHRHVSCDRVEEHVVSTNYSVQLVRVFLV